MKKDLAPIRWIVCLIAAAFVAACSDADQTAQTQVVRKKLVAQADRAQPTPKVAPAPAPKAEATEIAQGKPPEPGPPTAPPKPKDPAPPTQAPPAAPMPAQAVPAPVVVAAAATAPAARKPESAVVVSDNQVAALLNIQAGTVDKRFFVGMPSPPAAGVPAATVFAYPAGLSGPWEALAVLAIVIVPAVLMVSTVRFRSFKNFDLHSRRSYPVLLLLALGLVVLVAQPEAALLVLAYFYLASGVVGFVWGRLQRRRPDEGEAAAAPGPSTL